jgi:beta-aspartyl-peptidase (threonine type)
MKPATLAAAILAAGVSMSHAATPLFILHTGAGITRADLTPESEKHVREVMKQAAEKGYGILKSGGSSLDAVSAAIVILEDEPMFNAGKGAVFNHDGKNELDASIMDGATLQAGAVANVHRVKNPVLLARAVMEKSPHVMMVGDGAEEFAKSVGMQLVDPKYFYTERRWQELQKALKEDEEKK